MSAVPSIPETIPRSRNPDAALEHPMQSRAETVASDGHTPDRTPPWLLHDAPIENFRRLRVVVIGGGYSGIYCAIRIPERLRNIDLVCYEKNAGVGGTWYENRYPGVACDIPSHSYQYSFNPKSDWSALYAPGQEILEYLQDTCSKFGADRFIKLRHQVSSCVWNHDQGKWHIEVQPPTGDKFVDICDVLVSARGLLNTPQWPSIPGIDKFRGNLMHSAAWDSGFSANSKKIALIGSGSSAIQILPKLQKCHGTTISSFIRSRTWISPPFGQAVSEKLGMTQDDFAFSQEQISRFRKNPDAWRQFRVMIAADTNSIHAMTLKGTPMQKAAQKDFEQGMKQRLAKKPQYLDFLKPNFSPGCRRLTPGPGFLEALVEDNVEFVRAGIARIDEKGIFTEDGKFREVDAIICATGFYASAAPPFPVTGRDGRTLQEHWAQRSYNYLSVATNGFPNHFFMLGPNGAIGEGSLTMMIESAGDYIVKAVRKMQKENIRSMEVKAARVRDFTEYSDRYFAGTVFADDCASWYRKDGQGQPSNHVTGLWPGSCLHCVEAFRSPRWEDYEYEHVAEDNGSAVNQLGFLGNGWAAVQLEQTPSEEQLAFYILPQYLDVPLEGRPEDKAEYRIRPFSY